ncbi:MAG: 4-hydroxy-tetrahydrodipicolinate reductase [Clostridiales bacterium]|jgi:4-hydroxy-tetrahydrodipicolinate reductase|nr:4-hydroxy-tetrahydrodipicolinate reductase [Clostridiales bacterium]
MTKIIIHGCFGHMGNVVRRVALQTGRFEIAAGIDVRPPDGPLAFPVFTVPSECGIGADAVIDFSAEKAVPDLVEWCRENSLPLVLCTTGLSDETASLIAGASEKLPIFQSANMSLGINLMISLLERASAVLGKAGFDIEIVEKHHSRKTDAPSGTALMLANAMNKDGKYTYVTDRSQRRQRRPADEIGISAVRGGTVVGEHDVIFAGQDEVIEIAHAAYSRDIFAAGALKAAEFIARQRPGLYSMRDLINE